MTVLSTIKSIKSSLGLGNANYIPFINFGTGSPAPVRTSSASPQSNLNNYNITPGGPTYTTYPSQPEPQVLGDNNLPKNTPRVPISGGGTPIAGNQGQINTVNQNTGDQNSSIDAEFEAALNDLSNQESNLRGQAGQATNVLQSESAKTGSQIGQENQRNIQGLNEQGTTAQKTASGGMQQARDLFRQIQQQNIAQLSGAGISSSSVAEALAERLGVETARRISGISGSLEEVQNNIAKEKTRVNQVFQDKLTQLQSDTQNQIAQIQQSLQEGLSQVASLRGKAAVAKAQDRSQVAIAARNQIQDIQLRAQQASQALSDAAAKRAQALDEAQKTMFRPTDFSGLNQYVQNVGTLPQVGGFQAVPQFNSTQVAGQGFINPSISYQQPKAGGNPFDPNAQYDQWQQYELTH